MDRLPSVYGVGLLVTLFGQDLYCPFLLTPCSSFAAVHARPYTLSLCSLSDLTDNKAKGLRLGVGSA